MEIFSEISPLKAFLADQKKIGKSIGLVPTMGALHEGHLTLIRASQKTHDLTVCSLFVNPLQFNNPEDLRHYPRPLALDVSMLEKVGCDVLFVPDTHEMYPSPPLLNLSFGMLEQRMEGAFRPGHFSGVAIVVSKLLHAVGPDSAFFGQKDWQQFVIIKQLVKDLNFPVTLVSIPTVREADGLALSSRNLRIPPHLRSVAGKLNKILTEARNKLQGGESTSYVHTWVTTQMSLLPETRLEYFEVVESENLTAVTDVRIANHPILCMAAYVGGIRLIDNMFLDLHAS